MSGKNKFLATAAFYILVGVLLFYAASRTLHFVQLVMANSTWGYLFLFATGVGAVIWLYVYLSYAQGAHQRGISFAMGIVDLIGELALVFADTIYVGSQAGLVQMSPNEMNTFIIVSVGIVGINIFAGYLFKLADLQAQQEQHAQDLVDHVTAETMKHMNTPEARQSMVQELLPIYRAAIAARVQSEIFARASNTGIDAQSVGWPLSKPSLPEGRKYEQAIPHPIDGKQWICPKCTAVNDHSTSRCVMCGLAYTAHLHPPYGDRQHPDLIFARIPEAEAILQEWRDYDNQRIDQAKPKKEDGESQSPFR